MAIDIGQIYWLHYAEAHGSGPEQRTEPLAGRRYYTPREQGAEARIKEWLEKVRKRDDA